MRLRLAGLELQGRQLAVAATLVLVAILILGAMLARGSEGSIATIEIRPGRFLREVSATGTLKAVRATPIVVPAEVGREQRVAVLARDGASLKAGDLVVEFDPWQAQRESADGRADLASAAAKIKKADAESDKTARSHALDRDAAREALDRAEMFQIDDETLFSRHAIIEARLDRKLLTTKVDVAGRKLETSGRLSAAEHALGEIEAGKARLTVKNAEQGLRSLRILAPHDGLLVLARNWRGETTFVGDALWPGEKVAEIPDLSQLEAQVFILEADAAGLTSGLSAQVSIEGRPGVAFPAKVARVEPLAKSRDRGSPVKYFEATLALESTDASFMKPGERVRARLRLEEADDVIAIPRGALFEKDGKRVVYRRDGAGFIAVEVIAGRNSISRVVVEKGLVAGDRVALRDPTVRKPDPASPSRPRSGEAAR